MWLRRIAGAAAALSALCAQAVGAAAPPSDADITKSFEARIAQLDAVDPRAPQALESHLRYADYLAKSPAENCSSRLKTAQSQLQSARQNVAIAVVLPQGLARAADIEYQIHTALASCGGSPDAAAHRDAELRAALEAAQHAAALYQDSFDYPAMVTMQFNAALTYRSLGDNAAAITALEAVIATDREYGFSDDAVENYGLLLGWSDPGRDSDPERVAALMRDFPQRSATLSFGWVPGENPLTLKSQSARVIGNAVVHANGDRTLVRRVERRLSGWTVTYQSLASHYSLEPLPPGTGVESSLMTSLALMLLQFHDFTLKDAYSKGSASQLRSADFNQTIDRDSFESRAQAEAHTDREANSQLGGSGAPGTPAAGLAPVLNIVLNDLLLPKYLETAAALDYNLETGAWAGATLNQGQWYGMKISLPLPFAPLNFVVHEVQFAFTRELPCDKDSDRTCVEIVLRAIPDGTDLKYTLRGLEHPLHLRHGMALQASSTTYMRLITDPATLQARRREMRQQFYVSLSTSSDALLGADESVIDAGPLKATALPAALPTGACAVRPESLPIPGARTTCARSAP